MQTDTGASSPGRRYLGYILIAVGALMVSLCGACTLTWLGSIALSLFQSPTPPNGVVPAILLAVPVGGLPIFVGVAMIVGGRSLLKPPRRPLTPSSPLR